MEVIKFLKANGNNFQKLTEVYGIKVKDYPEQKLAVLNYDQINSPKMEPIVQECRGLILDHALNTVCRPFDRFFTMDDLRQIMAEREVVFHDHHTDRTAQ